MAKRACPAVMLQLSFSQSQLILQKINVLISDKKSVSSAKDTPLCSVLSQTNPRSR